MEPSPILWRVNGWGRQVVGSNRPYWWENRLRVPEAQVYAQLTLEGRIVHRSSAGEHWVEPGSLLLFKHGEDSSYGRLDGDTTPYHCEWVALVGSGLWEHWSWAQDRYGSLHDLPKDRRVRGAMNRLMDLYRPGNHLSAVAAAAAVQQFVSELFSVLEETRAVYQRSPVERAIEHLVSDPMSGGTLKSIAREHAVSREHLARAFHARFNQWPAAWLTQVRLGKALQLLRETALPVTEVARQSGFPSAHTLARQVRRASGKSPASLRRG